MRGKRPSNSTINGVAMASARAYRPTRLPAEARGTPRSAEMAGRIPTTMNSATPMAKAVRASTNTPGWMRVEVVMEKTRGW
ncbi:hypothetical protein D3C81_2141030 [compost metagenome]